MTSKLMAWLETWDEVRITDAGGCPGYYHRKLEIQW